MNTLQSIKERKDELLNNAPLEVLPHQPKVKKNAFLWKKNATSTLKEDELKTKGGKQSSKSAQKEEFEDGEAVDYYDIHEKRNVDAVIVRRITFGQYAIRVNNRVFIRKAFFLTKKSD